MEVPVKLSLSGLERLILVHLYVYGPDTPKLMARRFLGNRTRYRVEDLEAACALLEEKGLVERYSGSLKRLPTSSLKPWMKVKVKGEARTRGVYYKLTKKGKEMAKAIRSELFKASTKAPF